MHEVSPRDYDPKRVPFAVKIIIHRGLRKKERMIHRCISPALELKLQGYHGGFITDSIVDING